MMRYKGYIGKVDYDADAKLLHGVILGLRDVITFQSDSAAGIEAAFRESVDDYLAFCRQRGEQPEKPCSGRFIVRADAELHRDLVTIANATGKSLNTVVVESLRRETQRAAQPVPEQRSSARTRRRKTA